MKSYLLIALLLAGWVTSTAAQTTQPAPAAWENTVRALARSLVTGEEAKAQRTDDCSIRSFNSSSRQIADLTAHTCNSTLLMAKAYLFPGGAIAGDVGAAVQDAQVSDEVKKILVPAEGDPTARAN